MVKTRIVRNVAIMVAVAVGMAMLPSESQAGRHHRGGGCGGCYDSGYYTSSCYSGCYGYDYGCGGGGRHHHRGGGYGCGCTSYGYGEYACGSSYSGCGCDGGYGQQGMTGPQMGAPAAPGQGSGQGAGQAPGAAPGGEGQRNLPPAPAAPAK